ncbi:uncharacterized protein LOC110441325 [Mizuhopecten yessoensis]|uniref:uncharacterized protein LOC110441325 n=1 Tax=Mizuhopecten yessoensis TaxID=6573 RepID=UPI000B45BCF3|nr:uncharacterized protein LOC110441325 [Mizuhopecten yessoensis]
MLRAVAFQNFIYFRDHQSLEFEDGPNFIVGPNASGKTAIFELIRRCLSNNANASTSRVADIHSPAFVICKFEITHKLSDKVFAGCRVYSCLYIKPGGDNPKKMYKLVCITNTDEQQEKCYLDYYHNVKVFGPLPAHEAFILPTDDTELSQELDKLIKSKRALDNLDGMIQKMMESKQQPDMNTEPGVSGCENILQAIRVAVVVTFPIRSPGPIQWSHSGNIGKGNEHYDAASTKAEILQELLQSPDVDKVESNQIFETIIHPLKYHFKKNPDSTITVNDGAQDIRFLKVPEGIIEAKQFSLMFAHRKYQTLMLEEPDLGMHPPMIQRLRDLVLRRHNQDRKMVLVFTSHQPAMINRWAMDRMYVCRRKRTNDGKMKHFVFRLKRTIENIFQEQDKLKQMLYSSSVLFVEGITDKTVVELIFDRVLEAEHIDEEMLDLQKVVSGIQVISIDGSTPYNVLKTMGEKLELPCAFLFDSDSVFECLAKVQPKTGGKKWKNSTLFCVRILLKRMKEKHHGDSVEKSKEKTKDGTFKQVMKTPTAKDQKIQNELGLEESDLSDVKWTTVESFLRSVVLPATFSLNSKVVGPYALPENIKYSKDEQLIRNHMKEKKRVFLWDSGNLEDMICRSILDSGDQADDLLRKVFLCEKYDEGASNPKDPVKQTLKQMDITTAEKLSKCLLYCPEIKAFFKFLKQIEKKRPQL